MLESCPRLCTRRPLPWYCQPLRARGHTNNNYRGVIQGEPAQTLPLRAHQGTSCSRQQLKQRTHHTPTATQRQGPRPIKGKGKEPPATPAPPPNTEAATQVTPDLHIKRPTKSKASVLPRGPRPTPLATGANAIPVPPKKQAPTPPTPTPPTKASTSPTRTSSTGEGPDHRPTFSTNKVQSRANAPLDRGT